MLKIKVLTIGKCKETWLEQALEDYTKRLKGHLSIEWKICKDTASLSTHVLQENRYIALDVEGRLLSSPSFAQFVEKQFQEGGSRLSIVIGGAEGLPFPLREKATALISLSPLTFTHQMTRLILLEQLYRACEILKGSPYHKA